MNLMQLLGGSMKTREDVNAEIDFQEAVCKSIRTALDAGLDRRALGAYLDTFGKIATYGGKCAIEEALGNVGQARANAEQFPTKAEVEAEEKIIEAELEKQRAAVKPTIN